MNHSSRRASALVRSMVLSGFDQWVIERKDLALAVLLGLTGTVNSRFSDRSDYNLHRLASELSKFSSSCILMVSPDLVTPDLVCTMLQNTTAVTAAMVPYLNAHAYCVTNMLDMDCLFRVCSYNAYDMRCFSSSQPLAAFLSQALSRLSRHTPMCDLSRVPQSVALCDSDEALREFFMNACTTEVQAALGLRTVPHQILLEIYDLHGVVPFNTGLREVRNYRLLLDIVRDAMEEHTVDFTHFIHPSVLRTRELLEVVLDNLRPHAACRELYGALTSVFTLEYIMCRAGVVAYACFPSHAQALFDASGVYVGLPMTRFELDVVFEHAEVFVDTLDMRAHMYEVLETLRVTDERAYATLWRVQPAGCVAVAMYAGSINEVLQHAMQRGLCVEGMDNLVELNGAFSEPITDETVRAFVEREAVDMDWFTASSVDMVLPYLDEVLRVEDVLLPASADPVNSIFSREEVVLAYARKFRNHPLFIGAVAGSSLPVAIKTRLFERATEGGVCPLPRHEDAIERFAFSWTPQLLYNYHPTISSEVLHVDDTDLLEEHVIRLEGKQRVMVGARARKVMFAVELMRRCGGMRCDASRGHQLVLVESKGHMVAGVKFEQRRSEFARMADRVAATSHDLLVLLSRSVAFPLVSWGAPSATSIPARGFVNAIYSAQFSALHWGDYRTLDDDLLDMGTAFARANQPLTRAYAVAHYLYTYAAYFVLLWFYHYRDQPLEEVLAAIDAHLGDGSAARSVPTAAAAQQLARVVAENLLVSPRGAHQFAEAEAFVDAVVAGALGKMCEEGRALQN